MSTPILPYAAWASGTNQNSVPANDNSRRNQILNGNVISQVVTAQPASPAEGDIYIIPTSATGAQWATFTAKDLAIFSGGTWYAFAPVTGVIVNVAGAQYRYTGSAWTAVTSAASAPDEPVNAQTGTTYTYVTGDKSKLVTHTNASAIAGTLPQAGVSFPAGWWMDVQNRGAGTLTITPTTSTVDGAATLVLTTGQGVRIASDGTNYFTQRGMASGGTSSRTPSIQSVTSSATVTPTFSDDMVKITAQAAGLTLANPTGTAIDGLGIVIRIKDNGTARTIGYGTQYRAMGVTLPTTTVISKTVYLAMVFNNDDTKWDVLAVGQEP